MNAWVAGSGSTRFLANGLGKLYDAFGCFKLAI
jgi:hypothetical protein